MDDIKIQIQETRAELNKIILEKVMPLRAKLDKLLKEEAVRLCPFKVDDIITLDDGKKGKITDINYHSLNYFLGLENSLSIVEQGVVTDYVYAYQVDDKEFSITWKISGLRMIKHGTEVGKVTFGDISPDCYKIDITSKTVSRKSLNAYVANLEYLSDFLPVEDKLQK